MAAATRYGKCDGCQLRGATVLIVRAGRRQEKYHEACLPGGRPPDGVAVFGEAMSKSETDREVLALFADIVARRREKASRLAGLVLAREQSGKDSDEARRAERATSAAFEAETEAVDQLLRLADTEAQKDPLRAALGVGGKARV